MSEGVAIALIIAAGGIVTGLVAPVVLHMLTAAEKRAEKTEREQVAADLKRNTARAATAVEGVESRLETTASKTDATLAENAEKLDHIIALTNSEKTEGKKVLLLALCNYQTLRKSDMERRRAEGEEIDPEDEADLAATEQEIDALEQDIARRDELATEIEAANANGGRTDSRC